MIFVIGLWTFLRAMLVGSAAVAIENLALRHQRLVLQRSVARPRLSRWDRIFWVWLSRVWVGWRSTLAIVPPATVLATVGAIMNEPIWRMCLNPACHQQFAVAAPSNRAPYEMIEPHHDTNSVRKKWATDRLETTLWTTWHDNQSRRQFILVVQILESPQVPIHLIY